MDAEKNNDRLLAMAIVRGFPGGIPTREVAFLTQWDTMRAFAALKRAEAQGYVQYDANPGPGYEDRWLPLERRPGAFHHAERLRQQHAERAAAGHDPVSGRIIHADDPDAFDEGVRPLGGRNLAAPPMMKCIVRMPAAPPRP
jgi:hypothetical protein